MESSASRNTFSVSTITDGYARRGSRSSYLPSRRPDCTLSRLHAEEYDLPVTQSIATPEQGCPDPHPGSSAVHSLEPRVCHHTREPTVLSRVSCRPSHLNIDRFHQPCLFSWAHSRIGEDGHPRTTWRPLTLAGSMVLHPCVSLELPRRQDGTTARR